MYANYQLQTDAFTHLCAADCATRIVLFKGQSGCGKTTLLERCLNQVPATIHALVVDLSNSSAVGMAEIFSRSLRLLKHLPRFEATVERLSAGSVHLRDVTQHGSHNRIQVALTADNDRDARQVALTDAWFADIESLDQPLLVVLDTYEQARDELKHWLGGPFLARSAETANARVVVAGQQVPASCIEWKRCHAEYHLQGVREAEHWLPVVEDLGYCVPPGQDLYTCIATACTIYEGHPKDIMNFIKRLPRRADHD